MAYAAPRSVNNELHIGCREGGCQTPRKDWGGPQDARVREPARSDEYEYDYPQLDRPVAGR